MNVADFIKSKVLRMLGLAKLNGDPNNGRLTYINDDEAIRVEKMKANKVWYLGDGDELLNYYTNQQTYGWAKNPIYNRNKRQFFWGMSINEMVKRVHSGIPRAIVDTISAIVGMPSITGEDPRLDGILDDNDFAFMLTQRCRPMTLVEGDGCWKVNINPELCDSPLIEWYGSEDWGPICKSNVLIGAYFKSYYKSKDDKDYVLFETRTKHPEGMAMEYRLYRLGKSDDLMPCQISEVPELEGLRDSLIQGADSLLAVPLKYFFDPLHPNRGKSIYDGKLDLFDLMDEILTQAGQTNRVSTPVEYYPVDLLQRTRGGEPILPKVYNRQYVKVDSTPDGDGNMNNQIQVTQPDVTFDKYTQFYSDVLGAALIGVLSPSSLGIGIARDDNALAQREKEKQTIFTRNAIISKESKALEELFRCLLICKDYMETGVFKPTPYGMSVKYDEFANPSFESELQALGPAWAQGQISTERFVSLLWAGKLSDEEMAKEAAWLDENKSKDDFDLGALNGIGNSQDIPQEGPEEEGAAEPEEPVLRDNIRKPDPRR